jgi:16S rRNA C1402 (ribose-2'-O) methylase RsmI
MIKIEFFGEHGHNTWNLFLCMKSGVEGEGLEFHGYLPVDPGQNVHKLQLVCIQFQHSTKGLDEPRSIL